MSEIIDNYHNVQQDILETFVDRGQMRRLAEPTILPSGKRIPGLKLDHPRQLAVMHSLVRFANIAGGGRFTTADLYAPALDALGLTEAQYSLASFRYDLSKLRAKGLVEKVPRFPSLSIGRQGLLDLRGVPQAVRESLRPPHCRTASALPWGSPPERRKALRTRPPVSTHLRRSECAHEGGWPQGRRVICATRTKFSLGPL